LRSINLGLSAVLLLIIVTAFVEKRTINYEEKNVVNPIAELISSTYSSNNTPKLFAMSIPESTKEYMTGIHSASDEGEISPISGISNIVLFVMESTPASVIGLYNDSITVTPNLKKWRSISTRYNNMYAHMPSTPNSMLSMVAGIYPKLSFRSLLQDTLSDKMVTIPNELLKKNWTTSFFSSADLRFGNMDSFARKSGFETIGDSKTIDCSFDKFRITNSSLDGLDDRCIAQQYLRWTDDHKKQHKFSMLWTNQTHQPYFFDRDKEVQYSKNGELNHYLNAIKYSDEAFGILMEGLQRRGMLNNTVVIVVGDHGEAFGSHDQFNHGSHIYDENVHIPGIVYSPVLCKGGTDDRVAGLIDLPPTIGAIAGIKKSDFWQGRSLFSKQERKEAFYICPYSDFLCGLRDGKWKYIYNATTNTSELYDLEKDPLETNNVASKNRDIVKKEYELLGAWVQYQNKRIEDLKSTPKSAAPAATASNK
jgi:phosphoglycerol transferase MdoB-like AlkP superfamily enzyme